VGLYKIKDKTETMAISEEEDKNFYHDERERSYVGGSSPSSSHRGML